MREKKTYGLICLSAPGYRPVSRYCLPVARCQGSESIFTCDSRILLGSVSVTSGEKVNWGPKDATLYRLFPVRGHGPPHILCGAELRVCGGTGTRVRAREACQARARGVQHVWTEGYGFIATEEEF